MDNNNFIITTVNNILDAAIKENASDVHFEPCRDDLRVRFRIDGLLYTIKTLPKKITAAIIARLKIMSKLDIAEKRLPQDGQFTFNHDKQKIDIRVNACPFLHGEKIACRLLESSTQLIDIQQLGMTKTQQELFLNNIKKPQGLILVTGPTGSGKSRTLYSALNTLNDEHKNISTVEDPIEIQLDGINQVQVNPIIGLNFSHVLRALLRQDPDVLMVGEIRDTETANIAIRAAQTGHLVLSTLHTNNAIESITRLMNMGIKHYNLNNTINLIVAQRLVRKICTTCYAKGCANCKNGYKGRTGIFELLPMTNTIKKTINKNRDSTILKEQAEKDQIFTLEKAGQDLVDKKITTQEEITRILYT